MIPEWLDIASNDIGNAESLGPNDSPFLRKVLGKLNGIWLKGQPWCGSAMAYWMEQCEIQYPKSFYRARSWATWGTACGPVLGAVVVFERGGGGHVGIVTGKDGNGLLRVLGGNQDDAVRESWFEPAKVIAYRWPPGKALVEQVPPLMSAIGKRIRKKA